ncbi:conserved hypothetical protein [Sulfurovum sp. NBC37-1]|nr:conserved hypothetical protein [Sulfurovum sp. NBC37-1]
MRKSIYLDINIVIDILDTNRPNSQSAKALLKHLSYENIKIVISEDMLSTIFYIVKNKQAVLEFFQLIQKRWLISPFGQDVIKEAIKLSLAKNLDFEDTAQCLCAKENGCMALITNDHRFYDCGIKQYTSDEALKNISTFH